MKAERTGGSRGQRKWNCRDDNCHSATMCMRMCFQCDQEDAEFNRSKPLNQQPRKNHTLSLSFNLRKELILNLKRFIEDFKTQLF